MGLSQYEGTQRVKAKEKRLHKKTVCLASRPTTAFTCCKCDRDCHSQIGLHSRNRRCKMAQIYGLLRLTDANDCIKRSHSCKSNHMVMFCFCYLFVKYFSFRHGIYPICTLQSHYKILFSSHVKTIEI